jgi:hypothetical protein
MKNKTVCNVDISNIYNYHILYICDFPHTTVLYIYIYIFVACDFTCLVVFDVHFFQTNSPYDM